MKRKILSIVLAVSIFCTTLGTSVSAINFELEDNFDIDLTQVLNDVLIDENENNLELDEVNDSDIDLNDVIDNDVILDEDIEYDVDLDENAEDGDTLDDVFDNDIDLEEVIENDVNLDEVVEDEITSNVVDNSQYTIIQNGDFSNSLDIGILTQSESPINYIVGFNTFEDISVNLGTLESQIEFPSTIDVSLATGDVIDLSVSWEIIGDEQFSSNEVSIFSFEAVATDEDYIFISNSPFVNVIVDNINPISTFSTTLTSGDYEYQLVDGGAEITSYIGEVPNYSEITIPSTLGGYNVVSIGQSSFTSANAHFLKSVTIPNTVITIKDNAFVGCENLESITIPNSVVSIGSTAFGGCYKLDNVVIPDSVTSIGTLAFTGCFGLTSISLPNSITTISDSLFYYCNSLTSITLPESITEIGKMVFYNCTSLTNVNIPESVTTMSYYVFYNCSSLSKVVLPIGLTDVFRSFENAPNFTSAGPIGSDSNIEFAWITEIPNNTFYGASKLSKITIPDTILTIGNSAFKNCTSLLNIDLPDTITSIGSSAFEGCTSLDNIVFPSNVESLENSVFSGCTSLQSITNLNNVKSFSPSVFAYCTSLTHLEIPSGVGMLYLYTFRNCVNLKSVVIPKSVINIYNYSFYGASGLTDIYYYGSKEEWDLIDIYPNTGIDFDNVTIHYLDGIENETIKLSNRVLSMQIGDTTTLEIQDTSFSDVYWRTSDESIIKVDNGTVTAVGIGNAQIIVSLASDSSIYGVCDIIVIGSITEDLDLWGLSGLVYSDLDNYIGYTISRFINADKPSYIFGGNSFYNGTIKTDDYYINELGSYKILDTQKISNFYAVAFQTLNNEVVISYRGSNDLLDWFDSNFVFVMDMFIPADLINALNFYKEISLKYYDKDVILTGHSLGGALATFVSIMEDVPAVVFNAATGYTLEDIYYYYPLQISTFNGIDQWKFKNYYNADDGLVGAINNEWFNTLKIHDNNQSSYTFDLIKTKVIREHYLETIISNDDNGNISLSSATDNYSSYYNRYWQRTYKILNEVYLGSNMSTDKYFNANNDVLGKNIFYSSGDYLITGSINDDTFVTKNGDILFGYSGDDTYTINESSDFKITISDPSGTDRIYFKQFVTSQITINEDNNNYTIILPNNGLVLVDKDRSSSSNEIIIVDKYGSENTISSFVYSTTFSMPLAITENNFSVHPTQILGQNLEISILDENMNVLGSYTNSTDEVSTNNFAYIYPTNGVGIEVEIINDGKYIRIDAGENISGSLYTLEPNDDTLIREFAFNLSGYDGAIINTRLDESDNFYYILGDETTSVNVTELNKVTAITSDTSSISLYAGESETINLNFSPNNVAFKSVTAELTSDDIAYASLDDDGSIIVYGVSEGTDTLTITALDGSGITLQIPVTIKQDSISSVTSKNSSGTITNGSWSDSTVTVTATAPSEYDTILFTLNNGASASSSIEVENDGVHTVSIIAISSATGKRTKTETVDVCIDTIAPSIIGVEDNGVYYIGKKIEIYDANYSSSSVNGTSLTFDEFVNGKFVDSVGSYTVNATDKSGKSTILTFEIKALPSVSSITEYDEDTENLIDEIRKDFENNYYDFDESTREQLDDDIRALEDKIAQLKDPTNSDNDILLFRIDGQIGYSTFDYTTKTISVILPSSIINTSLVPTIDIPKGTTISPSLKVAQNFNSDVVYTVTAINNATSTWTIKATTPPADATAPILESSSISSNSIILEFDDYLDSSNIDYSDVTLSLSSRSATSINVTGMYALSNSLIIVFDEPFSSLTKGTYTLTILESSFYNVGGTKNTLITETFTLGNITTDGIAETTSYTITFNANGGTPSVSTATRSGYTFNGWFTNSSGGVAITTNYVFSSDTTVYAQWKNSNDDGSDSNYDNSVTPPEALVPTIPTNSGYFSGNSYSLNSIKTLSGFYIPEFRNVIANEYFALADVDMSSFEVNNGEFLGWYYDAEFTKPVELINDKYIVITDSIIQNGLYPKFAGKEKTEEFLDDVIIDNSIHNNIIENTPVPSTQVKLLNRLF